MTTRRRPALLLAVLGLFVALGAIGILHHEMWRDELEIWLIARDSDSLRHSFHNMRAEGQPLGARVAPRSARLILYRNRAW